jgi:hypothetical protein
MSNSVIDILQRYIEESKAEGKMRGENDTIAARAKVLGISVGTLSQLHSGKPITSKVIEKIVEKLAGGNETRKRRIREELRATLKSSNAEAQSTDALEEFDRFFKTSEDAKRLICYAYRDIPQSRDAGSYPGYVDRSSDMVRRGLNCAFFQPFGPLDKIKQKAKEALDRNDLEAMETWQYIYKLASGVHEVYRKGKKLVESGSAIIPGKRKGQLVLYEASEVSSLAVCDVNSRICYSIQQIFGKNEIRVVQMVRVAGEEKERFIECSTEPAFQTAVAAQFYPIIQYWRSNDRLPVKEDELMSYYRGNEKCPWRIWSEPMV